MTVSNFDELLAAARAQPQPQRLLFVFASAELPDDATPQQRARFEAGQGGALTPLMCVDKTPDELDSFASLREESRRLAAAWDIVFVAALAGSGGVGPSSAQAEAPLQRMIASIKAGRIDAYIPFDAQGEPVVFT